MSLILDALKKLEQEKGARRTQPVEIRPALTAGKSASSVPPRRLTAFVIGAVILTVAVTMTIMGRLSPRTLPVTQAASPLREQRFRPTEPDVIVTPPSPPLPDAPMPPKADLATPHPPANNIAPAAFSPPPRTKGVEPVMTVPTPADLKVTGIAWQDERAARRAVVNGALLGEGAEMLGARIVEIRQDQVRFSRDGETFAIPITSSNR